ncbi:YceD family protein [Arthrobacter russicus]|uniref:YceD family protein n=1 Tax=Arthrobacter russicus TaxID=172040 RepID=UPI00286BB341|nr:YceD family protein [Arthrobacter russicus]
MLVAIKDFGRSPGSMRAWQDTVAAPGELGTPMIGVQEGSDIRLDLNLEAVHEGIFVSGTATVHVVGECSRCLDPLAYDLDVDIQEMFFFEEPVPERGAKEELEDDDEQRLVEHDHLDLEPVLRDAVVTALPFQPVCQEDCQGLCSECGVRLADNPGHRHEVLDPRWAALGGLTQDQEQQET